MWILLKHFLFVVTVGIIWNTDRPRADYITEVLDCLGESLYLIDVSMSVLLLIASLILPYAFVFIFQRWCFKLQLNKTLLTQDVFFKVSQMSF